MTTRRLITALLAVLTLTGCGNAADNTAGTNKPSPSLSGMGATEPNTTPSPTSENSDPSPPPTPTTSLETLAPIKQTPSSSDELPDIWPDIAGLWASRSEHERDITCDGLDRDESRRLAVRGYEVMYKHSSGEAAETEDVHLVLAWLCSSNQ